LDARIAREAADADVLTEPLPAEVSHQGVDDHLERDAVERVVRRSLLHGRVHRNVDSAAASTHGASSNTSPASLSSASSVALLTASGVEKPVERTTEVSPRGSHTSSVPALPRSPKISTVSPGAPLGTSLAKSLRRRRRTRSTQAVPRMSLVS